MFFRIAAADLAHFKTPEEMQVSRALRPLLAEPTVSRKLASDFSLIPSLRHSHTRPRLSAAFEAVTL